MHIHATNMSSQVKLAQSLYSIKIDFYIPKGKKQIVKLYDFSRNNKERSNFFCPPKHFPTILAISQH